MLSIATVCGLKSKNILAIAGFALLPIVVGKYRTGSRGLTSGDTRPGKMLQ